MKRIIIELLMIKFDLKIVCFELKDLFMINNYIFNLYVGSIE